MTHLKSLVKIIPHGLNNGSYFIYAFFNSGTGKTDTGLNDNGT